MVLLLVFLSYVPILNTPLVADDYYLLSDSVARNPWRFFLGSVFPPELHAEFLRPLTVLTFALDHHLSGFRPLWPHLANVLFHLATTALVGLLVILPAARMKATPSDLLPLVAAMLLFGLHPQSAEAACWVSVRFDVMCAFFGAVGIIAWLTSLSKPPFSAWRLAAILAFVLSLLCKETGIVFFVAVGGFELVRWKTARGCISPKDLAITLSQMVLPAMAYLVYRYSIFNGAGGYRFEWAAEIKGINWYDSLGYMLVVLWPFAHPGPIGSPTIYGILATAAAGILLIAWKGKADGPRSTQFPWVLALLLWVLPAAMAGATPEWRPPAEAIAMILHHGAARMSYVSLIGFAVGCGWLLARWQPQGIRRHAVTGCLVVLLSAYVWVQQGEVRRWDKAGRLAESILDQIVTLVPEPAPNATILAHVPLHSGEEPYAVFGLGLKEALIARYGRSDLHIDQYARQRTFENPPPNSYALKFDHQQQGMMLTHSPSGSGTSRE
jgi:hypothetical protein